MKALIASIFALTLLGATAANAGVGAGASIVGSSITVRIGDGHQHHARHHYRHCTAWGWRHHHRYCRRWGW